MQNRRMLFLVFHNFICLNNTNNDIIDYRSSETFGIILRSIKCREDVRLSLNLFNINKSSIRALFQCCLRYILNN